MSDYSDEVFPTIPADVLPYFTGELVDDADWRPQIIQLNIAFIVLVTITAGARLGVRTLVVKAGGLDDLMMIFAVFFAWALSITCIYGAMAGVLGIHTWNVDRKNPLNELTLLGHSIIVLYTCYITYASAITFVKFSIISSYLRYFPHPRIRFISIATGVIVFAFWVITIFCVIFTCSPVSSAWILTEPGKCYNIITFFYVSSAFNVLTDVILCVLPMPILWKLQIPTVQRITVCCLFAMGMFAAVASCFRMATLHIIAYDDVSYSTIVSLNWSVAEVGTCIVCASLSTLRPLFQKIVPARLARHFRTQKSEKSAEDTEMYARTISDDGRMVKATSKLLSAHTTPGDGKFKSRTLSVELTEILKDLPQHDPGEFHGGFENGSGSSTPKSVKRGIDVDTIDFNDVGSLLAAVQAQQPQHDLHQLAAPAGPGHDQIEIIPAPE